MPKIGLKKAYYAQIVEDVMGAITYGIPVPLTKMQQISVNPKVSRVQVPGDDIIQDDISECLGADVTMQREEITPAEEAVLLGRITDVNGGVFGGSTDNAPYVAFGYMRTFKNSNVGLYVWLLKTKFSPSNSTADTKPVDNITPQYDSMSGAAITRTADGQWIYSIKSSDPAFGDTFFTKATLETLAAAVTPDALALSTIVPAAAAVGIVVTANVVITFNNKIASESITLMKADGTLAPGAKTWDATGKILTIDPTVNMSAATTYIVAVNGVKDIYGQALAATTKTFTTA